VGCPSVHRIVSKTNDMSHHYLRLFTVISVLREDRYEDFCCVSFFIFLCYSATARLPLRGPSTDRYGLLRSAQTYRSSGPSPSRSGTGGELSTASVALSPPTYCILLRSSPVGKLAVFFGNVFLMALVNPLRGSGS
jgi:hypothetical protein